jgi:putative ABC transport system ATP-binding protein
MIIVKTRKLNKVFKLGEVSFKALSGINLDIEAGEFLALAGPSGSGKTTLLNLIGCLDKPTEGEVFLGDKSVAGMSSDQLAELRKSKLGFVFQSYNLIPVLTAYENVEYPLILNKISKQERKQRVINILNDVGLKDKMHNFPSQLSGGQQQRVSIARALVNQPMLVLADEPTANLDSKTGEEIVTLMQKLNREKGITFIFSTHDQRIMNHASRLIMLKDGEIA